MDSARERAAPLDGMAGYAVARGRPDRREDPAPERGAERGTDRRDEGDGRPREPQRADAPIVERERAIVPLDPPAR